MNAVLEPAAQKIAVRVFGEGPDLALIHGWGIGAGVWTPVIEPLAARCRVHVVDLPGYGASRGVLADTHDSLPRLADSLMAVLPEKVTLAGWSLGGLIAIGALAKHQKQVAKLALVASTPSFLERPDWPHGVAPHLMDVFETALKLTPGLLLRRFNAQINQGDTRAKELTRLTESLVSHDNPDIGALKGGLHLLRELDLRPLLPKIKHPTLLIHGENDPLMKLSGAESICAVMPNARLEVLSGASHIPFLSQSERFATLLADFAAAPSA